MILMGRVLLSLCSCFLCDGSNYVCKLVDVVNAVATVLYAWMPHFIFVGNFVEMLERVSILKNHLLDNCI